MEPRLIISALIRLVSLEYVFAALLSGVSLPAHLSMLLDSSMSGFLKASGKAGLISDATNIGFRLIVAIVLWIYAVRIAAFVLKTIHLETQSQTKS